MIQNTNYNIVKVVSPVVQEQLLSKCNLRYKCIVVLMLDCGLRVTETVSLRIKNFNFFEKVITVKSLKKRGVQHYRTVPMTKRVIDTLANYWDKIKVKNPDAFIFPSPTNSLGHLGRKQVWKKIKQKTDGNVNPHMLRHTFATRVVNEGNSIRVAQDLLGHSNQQTTEIYLHVREAEKRKAIETIELTPWYRKLYHKLVPERHIILTPATTGLTNYHVGRTKELAKLSELQHKKVNTYIQGDQGVGKTHLLDAIAGEKILRMEEYAGKKTLINLLVQLFENDKRNLCEMMYGIKLEASDELPDTKDLIINKLSKDREDLTKVISKDSVKRLIELAIEVTTKDEYTILIDDVTNITKSGVTTLEKLKNHFHLIVAARNIKIDKGTFLTNFEKIELKNLDRGEATELINLASKNIYTRIEDYEAYKNHIWENTNGNPLFIIEMIDRYSKEANISLEITKDIQHTTALKEINMALPLIIMVSGLMVLRYYGREAGDDSGAFMLFGGIFMIFALFARPLAALGKRKWI